MGVLVLVLILLLLLLLRWGLLRTACHQQLRLPLFQWHLGQQTHAFCALCCLLAAQLLLLLLLLLALLQC